MAKAPTKKSVTKAAVKTGAKAVAKRAIPAYAAYAVGKAVKEKRYGDVVGEAAWLTIPTGVMYETAKMLPKETAKDAKARKSRNWKI